MNPEDPVRDIMRRTMLNLRFVDEHATPQGPYEVTQLINSFLGAVAHPWEKLKSDLDSISLEDAAASGWPQISRERESDKQPESLGDLIRLVRNGIAHGNIEWMADQHNEITAIRIWNTHPNTGRRTWGSIIRIEDMRRFLDCFVRLAEDLHARRSDTRGQTA